MNDAFTRSLFVIEAEDNTPLDGTTVTLSTAAGAQIKVRDAANPELQPGVVAPGFVNGLRAGAFGLDGNTDSGDGAPGGYVDFGATNADSVTFSFDVAPGDAGAALLRIRYANGSDPAQSGGGVRPLALEVNGVRIATPAFAPTPGATAAERWSTWAYVELETLLVAGRNTVKLLSVANTGPNIDRIEVMTTPEFTFYEAEDAVVTGGAVVVTNAVEDRDAEGRGFVDFVPNQNEQRVSFTVEVDTAGVYDIGFRYALAASKADRPAGLFVNNVFTGTLPFVAESNAAETVWSFQEAVARLSAGVNTISIAVPKGNGANLDQLRVAAEPIPVDEPVVDDPIEGGPPAGDAQITIQSLDAAYFDNRLHFSWLDNNSASAKNRDFKESATVRIGNEGSDALELTGYIIDGPFTLANPSQLDSLMLQPGGSIDVVVNFNRAAYVAPATNAASGVFTGAFRLLTNDASDPEIVVELGGFWQARDEGGWEPSVNEVWQAFGFGTAVAGVPTVESQSGSPLNNRDIYEAVNELEVLSPYWRLADGVTEARITQIAAYHGAAAAGFGIHAPGVRTDRIILSNHSDTNNQTLLPLRSNGAFATSTFTNARIPDAWAGADTFGFYVDGTSSDPTLNAAGPGSAPAGVQRGHYVRLFTALDGNGDVIPNVYLMLHDYPGVNYDYNDNMYVIEGVTPVSGAPRLTIAGLDDAFAGDGLALSRIDKPRNASQEFRDVATFEIVNDGSATLTVDAITIGNPAAFRLVGAAPTSIAAGEKATVTVAFTGVDGVNDDKAVLFESALTIRTNAGTQTIGLGGVAQLESENGEEPSVAQIVKAFGYATDMAQGRLANGGRVEAVGDEVLSPYFTALDASKPVEIIQLAAYLRANDVARTFVHDLSSAASATELFAQDGQNYQTLLPDALGGSAPARGVVDGSDPFGVYIRVDNRPTFSSWSDPVANREDPALSGLVGADRGHLVRYFTAKDADGDVIAGTYIGLQDYPGGGNFDYNDTVFLVTNVTPYALGAAEDANRDGVNDALQTDRDRDGVVAFFDTNETLV